MSAEGKEKEMERIEKSEIQSHTWVAIAQAMSEEEFLDDEKSLKRKLDLRLTSMIVFIYILNFLDRVSTNSAH
jgi:hypothetical protein